MKRHASLNHIYRLVWSRVKNAWIAVSEISKGQGKSGRGKALRRTAVATALSLAFTPLVHANPMGAQIVSGSASIASSGNLLTVTNSPNAIINWQSFSIGANQTTNFIQQSASSAVLNRVVTNNPSSLLGTLTSNGQVYLINPAGILVGQGAKIDVAGLVASTLNISNTDFANGKLNFTATPNAGAVGNSGTITTPEGGSVYLVAPQVENNGIITTPKGETILAAGSAVQLVDTATPGVTVQVTGSATTATNLGQIIADTGRIGVVGAVVNNSGTLNANSLVSQGGKIFLRASNNVTAGGVISAQGIGGGAISVLADKQNGSVNVTGTLDASAPSSGNGGFIETSAAQVNIASNAKVTTAAAMGLSGSWLIDPKDFTIAATGGDITGATLSSELGGGNVTIQNSSGANGTSGNINVNDTVTWSANKLTLNAYNNININTTMNASGTASLALKFGQGAVASSGNTSQYTFGNGAQINLPAGNTFSTTQGSNGVAKNFTVITGLGSYGSVTGTDLQGMNGNLSVNYALGSNIDALVTATWGGGLGFTPIGSSFYTPYTGVFDGLGHTISGLNINFQSGTLTTYAIGLFGRTSATAVIRDIGLTGGSIVGSNLYFVGGLVGGNYGTITNSYSTVNIIGNSNGTGGLVGSNFGKISNSYATGNVSGTSPGNGSFVGGLVGNNSGAVSNSYATGSVSGSALVGGLIGDNYGAGAISNSYATGSVTGSQYVGGLVGRSTGGAISNSYALGNVGGTVNIIGGLVGYLSGGTINTSYAVGNVYGSSSTTGGLIGSKAGGTVTNSYWDTTTSGQATSAGGVGKTSAQMLTASSLTGFTFTTTPGATGNNWVIVDTDGSLNNAGSVAGATFPMLASEYSTTISNAHQLQLMVMAPAANYVLFADISAMATYTGTDVWSSAGFAPVGNATTKFTGSLDGHGHSILNLTINRPTASYAGLFGYTGATAAIRNVALVGDSIIGASNVGGLVGYNLGVISNSYTIGNVSGTNDVGGVAGSNGGTISSSYTSGSASGTGNVGGLAGYNNGTVSNSYANGNATGSSNIGGLVGGNYGTATIINSYSSDSVSGTNNLGGLVGRNDISSTINDSYANGSVTGGAGSSNVGGLAGYNLGTISNSYSTESTVGASAVGGLAGANSGTINTSYAAGSVSGSGNIGGLVGSGSGTVNNSYWDITTSGQATSAGGTGLTTSQMQTASSFTGFTFTTTPGATGNNWVIVDADGSLNNAGGAAGATFPLLASEYSTTISNAHQLQLMAMALAANYTLSANINASTTANGTDVWGSSGFAPTGNSSTPYTGTFDGLGHTISNLTINQPTENYVGLFGYTGAGAVIRNFGLMGGSVNGGSYVGGLVGYNLGTISNSYSMESAVGASAVGGLAGANSGTINTSYAAGSVSGSGNLGGLVGSGSGTVNNSYWDITTSGQATSAGGTGLTTSQMQTASSFTGFNFTTTPGATGNNWVIVDADGGLNLNNAGGWTGETYPMLASEYSTTISNAHQLQLMAMAPAANYILSANINASGTANGTDVWGSYGFIPISEYYTVTYTFDGLGHTISNLTGNQLGSYGGLFGYAAAGSVIRNVGLTGGSVNGGPYVGGLVGYNLGTISNSYNTGNVSGAGNNVGGLVGYNLGTINNSYNTGNVSGGRYNAGGLAGYNSGAINNSYSTGNVSGGGYNAGGLVGNNLGAISNSYSTGNVSGVGYIGGLTGSSSGWISTSYATGNVSGSSGTGGLVGFATGGAISNSYATGNVSALNTTGGLAGEIISTTVVNCYATGNVFGGYMAGGLIGDDFRGNISTSYATGNVTGSTYVGGLVGNQTYGTTTNTYASGGVTGGRYVGGLIGMTNGGTIWNNYSSGPVSGIYNVGGFMGRCLFGHCNSNFWDTTTSNQPSSDGATGLTTAQMQTQANFTSAGWDFTNTWIMYSGYTYPMLRFSMISLTVTANAVTVTYNGQSYSGGNGVNYSNTPNAMLQGTLSYSGTSQGATNVGSYTIVPGGLYSTNYAINFVSGTLQINPEPISLSGSRVYNDLTSIVASVLTSGMSGLIGTQTLGLTGTGSVASKNVGVETLSLGTLALTTGTGLASNYTLVGGTDTATITPKVLSVTGTTASNKTYDGTTAAALSGGSVSSGVFSGDTVTLNQSGTFSSPNVGTSLSVTATDSLSGASAGDYTLTEPTGLVANITQRVISLSGSSVYNGTTSVAGSIFTLGNLVGGQTLNLTGTGSVASQNVSAGAQTVSLGTLALSNGTGLASNYKLTGGTDTASITPEPINLSGGRVYDGTTSVVATVLASGMSGLVGTQTLVLTGMGSVASQNVSAGAQTVSLGTLALSNGSGLASNYTLVGGTDTASIAPTSISLSGSRVYDGTTSVAASVLASGMSGLIGTETLGLTGTGSVASKNVSAGIQTVSLGTLMLTSGTGLASNYALVGGTQTVSFSQLSSVTWVGSTTGGSWSTPANWAGGAIPDLNNVANVVIPVGTNVIFDSSVAGPVNLVSLSSGGLTVNSGTMNITSALNLQNYVQSGGTLSGGGGFTVTNSFAQTAGQISMGGDVSITHVTGNLSFANIAGNNITLVSSSGEVILGNLSTVGTLGVTASGGTITQSVGTMAAVSGATNLTASNGGAPADITLSNAGNTFGQAVSASGNNVSITVAGSLALGTVTTTGNLTANSSGPLDMGTSSVGGNLAVNSGNGDVTQTGPLAVTGTTAITAGTGNITLANAGNTFAQAVSASGNNVSITDAGSLALGAVTATGNLTANSSGALDMGTSSVGGNLAVNSGNGDVTQTGPLAVTGTTAIAAGTGNITLTDPGNTFGQAVTASGNSVVITNAP
jgi:filamentous hemagglutinin family protein